MAKNVFISYAHKDEEFLNEFKSFSIGLKRQGLINPWQDREIKPGEEWDPVIKKALHSADIIIFLVTQNFIFSKYIYDIEIKEALERYDRDEATIIPIIISNCDFNSLPLKKFQALPKDAKPISQWATREDGWMDVVNQLRNFLTPNEEDNSLDFQENNKEKVKKKPLNSLETARLDIQNGRTARAIDTLLKYTKEKKEDSYNSAILVSSRFNSAKNKELSGTISNADLGIENARIAQALLQIIDELES